jgi:AAA ATPase domain
MIATNGAVMASSAGLDDLVRQILAGNPFTDNRVNGPAAGLADAHDIHHSGFDRLTDLALEARDQRRGLGAVLWGEAGIGKSHVLARFGRWAEENDHACFVYLHNLQASPDGLPRSLLKTVVSILTNGWVDRFHRTPLFRLVANFAHEAFGYPPDGSRTWREIERAYFRLVDQESARGATHAALADRTVYRVLLRFFHSAYAAKQGQGNDGAAALAVRWLSGDFLDPAEAERLRLPPGAVRHEPIRLADNQQIKAVLVAFCRLALAARQPFLLCFDQADNLDDAQMAALARFLEALIDAAPNLLVVTAGIQSSLLHWRSTKVIQDSAWDRLAQFEVSLQRVRPAEAERIVAARIAGYLGSLCDDEPLRDLLTSDPLFPLGHVWQTEFLGDRIDLRPRDVLNWAREGWRREQEKLIRDGGAEWSATWGERDIIPPVEKPALTTEEMQKAVERRVTRQIDEQQAQRRAHPASLPPDGERLLGLIRSLLEQCRQVSHEYAIAAIEEQPGTPATRRLFDLLLRRRLGDWEQVARLLVVVTAAPVTAAGFLRRLLRAAASPGQLVLVTDQRRPLPLGAKGQEYLNKLKQGSPGRFRHVELTFADILTLDALQAVVGQARSADLEVEIGGRSLALTEADVMEALHRLGLYRSAPLLRDLLAPPSSGTSG